MMLNRWIGVGRLVRDPDLRYTSKGTPVCNFTLACERNYKNKQGKRDVDFIKIVTWRKLAETCAQHLGKGRLVAVEGGLQIRKSEKNDRTYINPEVIAENVQFLDWPQNNENGSKTNVSKRTTNNTSDENGQAEQEDDNFDVPF